MFQYIKQTINSGGMYFMYQQTNYISFKQGNVNKIKVNLINLNTQNTLTITNNKISRGTTLLYLIPITATI